MQHFQTQLKQGCFFDYFEINHTSFVMNMRYLWPLFMGSLCSRPPALCLVPGPGPQFVFANPGPQFVFTDLGPQFVFTGPGSQFIFTSPGHHFVFTGRGTKFVFPGSDPSLCLPQICIYGRSSMPEFAYTDLVSPIYIYWSWPTISTHTGC